MSSTNSVVNSYLYSPTSSTESINQAKVRFRASQSEKSKFHLSSCILTISLGNPNQYGYKFRATLLKAIQTFKSVNIMLADSLQAHNIRAERNTSLEDGRYVARVLGDEWIIEHRKHIPMHIYHKIIRYDHLLSSPNFEGAKKMIDNLYNHDKSFRESVKVESQKFATHKIKNHGYSRDQLEALTIASQNYILEECCALIVLGELNFNYEVYPSRRIAPMEIVYDNLVCPYNAQLLKEVTLEIKTKRASQMPSEAL